MPPRLIPARGNEPLRRSVPAQFGENHEGTRRYTNGIQEWHTASSGGISTPSVSVRIHSWFKLSHDPKIKNAPQDRPDIRLSPPRVALLSRIAEVHPPPPPREGVKPFYAERAGHIRSFPATRLECNRPILHFLFQTAKISPSHPRPLHHRQKSPVA